MSSRSPRDSRALTELLSPESLHCERASCTSVPVSSKGKEPMWHPAGARPLLLTLGDLWLLDSEQHQVHRTNLTPSFPEASKGTHHANTQAGKSVQTGAARAGKMEHRPCAHTVVQAQGPSRTHADGAGPTRHGVTPGYCPVNTQGLARPGETQPVSAERGCEGGWSARGTELAGDSVGQRGFNTHREPRPPNTGAPSRVLRLGTDPLWLSFSQ